MYKLTGENWVLRVADQARIPITDDPLEPNTNPHYLAYKEWLAEGNTPEPADIVPVTAETIADRRWRAEVAGIVWQGHGIATDRESQQKMSDERSAVKDGLRAEGKGWKCLDLATGAVVFRPTSNAEILDLTAAAYRHVSDCFDREAELLDALSAGTFTHEMLDQGWPA